MNMKNRREHIAFICMVVILIFACDVPANQPPAPSNYSDDGQTKQDVTKVAANPPTQVIPSISAPGTIQTEIPSQIPPTAVPLPDFEQVLNFAGGGAGGGDEGWCDPAHTPHDAVTTSFTTSVTEIVADYGSAYFCLPVAGIDLAQPFHLQLTSPDGKQYSSPDLWLNQHAGGVDILWDEYAEIRLPFGFANWENDNLAFVSLPVWWPSSYPEGQWHVKSYGNGFSIIGDILAYKKKHEKPYIFAYDSRLDAEIMPTPSIQYPLTIHFVKLNSNGKLDVAGRGYPPNTVIYIVLYEHTAGVELRLIDKSYTVSDSMGSISTELDSSFELGKTYWIVGLSNPNTPLMVGDFADITLPSDSFIIQQSESSGAPRPQVPYPPTPVDSKPYIDNVNLSYEGSHASGVTAYWDISFHDADGDVNYVNYKVIDVTPPTDVVVNGGSVDVSSDAQKSGGMITGRWSCNGAVYNITFSAILYDAAGNQSAPYTYTMTCY
jgi:hypothetical protein